MEDVKELSGDIIYVTTPERAINYKWEKKSNKLSSDIQVVSIDDIKNFGRDVIDAVVRLDTILTKHPFTDKYIGIDKLEEEITNDKLLTLGKIAFHLGVREYETLYGFEDTQEAKMGADGQANYKFAEIGTKFNIQEKDVKTGKYWSQNTFEGNVLTEDSYAIAVERAKEFGLYYDDDVQFLLETRNPRYGNRLTSRRIKCELTRELNRSLDIAFNLKFASIFSLNANYNQVLIQRKKIVIETNFIF